MDHQKKGEQFEKPKNTKTIKHSSQVHKCSARYLIMVWHLLTHIEYDFQQNIFLANSGIRPTEYYVLMKSEIDDSNWSCA